MWMHVVDVSVRVCVSVLSVWCVRACTSVCMCVCVYVCVCAQRGECQPQKLKCIHYSQISGANGLMDIVSKPDP